jgi:hypothetical protein
LFVPVFRLDLRGYFWYVGKKSRNKEKIDVKENIDGHGSKVAGGIRADSEAIHTGRDIPDPPASFRAPPFASGRYPKLHAAGEQEGKQR